MNRHDWEKQVFASNLDSSTRLVAIAIGTFGSWNKDRPVYPSIVTVAGMCGMSRRNTHRHITKLREYGWLVEVDRKLLNVAVYELSIPVETPMSLLDETPVSLLNNLDVSEDESVGTYETVSRDIYDSQLGRGCPINIEEPTKEHRIQDVSVLSPVADAPVDVTSSLNNEVKEVAVPSNPLNCKLQEPGTETDTFNQKITDPLTLRNMTIALNIHKNKNPESEIWDRVWSLATSLNFRSDVITPAHRVGLALQQVANTLEEISV